jgi:hypothetical protein
MTAVDHLGEILAVIHGDGGHHTIKVGVAQSVSDAHATWAAVVRERDELRAQVAFIRDEYGVNADNGTMTRDALEQKIQVLIDERRQLRARLVECRAWAGRCPYPNTPAFDELIAVRELADDTLEEVKP